MFKGLRNSPVQLPVLALGGLGQVGERLTHLPQVKSHSHLCHLSCVEIGTYAVLGSPGSGHKHPYSGKG